MLKGVDLLTYAECLAEGKEMVNVEYLAGISKDQERRRISMVREVVVN